MGETGEVVEHDDELDACFGGSMQVLDVPIFGLSAGFQLQFPHQPSMTRILREVKRQEHSIRNLVASIVYDARTFVAGVGRRYEGWPVFGNQRCGAWYVPPEMQEVPKVCYFKSTDGHVNKWSFSFARLNLHVALDAVRHGGCVIVDATRRGKMFPDALSKTVPIWCAVVNTAVALYRMDADGCDADGCEVDDMATDLGALKLPAWVPEAEASQIEAKIDVWAMQLLDARIEEFEMLAREMTAPLECVWAHPSMHSSHSSLPEGCELGTRRTVVVLASASVYGSRERRSLVLEDGNEFVFEYVAGAGDDEESWAMGLTPPMMWANFQGILMEGEACVERLVGESVDGGDVGCDVGGDVGVVLGNADNGAGNAGDVRVMTPILGTGFSMASYGYVIGHVDDLRDSRTAIVNVSSRDLGNLVGCEPSSMVNTSMRNQLTAGSVKSKECRIIELDADASGKVSRYCWTTDASSRKHAVTEYAPCVTEFVSYHAAQGRSVVFVYDTSTGSIAASLVIAAIIALFTLDESKFRSTRAGYRIEGSTGSIMPAVGRDQFSREVFRKYVAKVTVQIPHIVLRKSILKEVFNVFIR